MAGEIMVVPFFGQGHLLPCGELCKQLVSRGFTATLIIQSSMSSSIAPSVRQNPGIKIYETDCGGSGGQPGQPPSSPDTMMMVFKERHKKMDSGIEGLLLNRRSERLAKPVCAVIDVMMDTTKEVFAKFEIPALGLLTSPACEAAVQHCMWKTGVKEDDIKPGQTWVLPGLPEEMAFSYLELKQKTSLPPGFKGCPPPFGAAGPPGTQGGPPPFEAGPPGAGKFGPPKMGEKPQWVCGFEGSLGLLINSCDELEHHFLEYLRANLEVPVWGVGPLLPEAYWRASGSLVRDGVHRASQKSNYSEDEVVKWLDSKPRASVLYVSFGSQLSPSDEECAELAIALGESNQPFIWVLQADAAMPGPLRANAEDEAEGYFPHDLASKVGKRGLIIKGWAPQLMILSHPSTGGFLSHCGWNSAAEAIGRGIPILAWPIRGDQFYTAKMVVRLLKIGYVVTDDFSQPVKREQIAKGVELLMSDDEMKKRAGAIAARFKTGFPASSVAALDAFRDFVCSSKCVSTS